ncbi:MAG: D-glycerate dehydrogenase [Salinivirgaceae bacterium]|jgi:glyoxylate reductase|nr:D-glycerate dehydrogenase [Salinivirgaceae bacterium]
MTSKKILITRLFPEIGAKLLKKAGFEITQWQEDRPMTQSELIEQAKGHHGILCTLTEKIDSELLSSCPNIEIISQFAVGYDNIDVKKATQLGIPVGYTPDVLSAATADIAFGLMVATSRKMFYLHKSIIEDKWDYFKPNANLGIELHNKTLGIFGLGRIGFEMAKLCKGAYNMNVIYNNRTPNKKAEQELGANWVDFETLLAQSDVLSVHCALTPATNGIFNKKAFDKMKLSSIFINTARGLIHNETDLIEALNSQQIWGVGLDVTNPEPMKANNPLLVMENVSVLPHVGSGTVETRDKMAIIAANNIIGFYKNKQIPHIINPEVLQD